MWDLIRLKKNVFQFDELSNVVVDIVCVVNRQYTYNKKSTYYICSISSKNPLISLFFYRIIVLCMYEQNCSRVFVLHTVVFDPYSLV